MLKKNSKIKWLFVILGVIMFMCMGTVYSWSVFRTPVEQLYDLDLSQSGLPYLVFLVAYTLGMVLTGRLADRLNPRLLIVVGGLLIGTGWILAGFARSFAMLIISYGVIAGTGVGIAYGPPLKVITRWFDEKRGMALGLLLGGFGLSPLVTAPIARMLIVQMGVSSTFIVVGIAMGILIPLIGWIFRNPDEYHGNGKVHMGHITQPLKDVLKSKKFIGLWACFIIGTTAGLMIIGISSQIGVELYGLTMNQTAALLSIFAVFNAVGRPLFGWLVDHMGSRKASILSFTLMVVASALLFVRMLDFVAVYIVALALFWMNLGAWLSIAPVSIGTFFGQENYSRNYGILFTAYGIGAVIGTPVAAWIKTVTGSYHYIALPIAILALIGMGIATISMPKKTQNIS